MHPLWSKQTATGEQGTCLLLFLNFNDSWLLDTTDLMAVIQASCLLTLGERGSLCVHEQLKVNADFDGGDQIVLNKEHPEVIGNVVNHKQWLPFLPFLRFQ